MGEAAQLSQPPLTLYVHLPWCVRKCPYCDFNSHELNDASDFKAYTRALIADLQTEVARCWGRPVHAVFFGGGTPSLFPPAAIGEFLQTARACLNITPDAEITLEANPGTIEHGRFSDYAEAGINRVSLGAQTFNAAQLEVLGRIHGPDETGQAVDELRAAGLDNFNIDLMYGLPGQRVEDAIEDVRRALALGPSHLSHYQLTLEPNTRFAADPPALPGDDLIEDQFAACAELMRDAGFDRYEVSAWCLPGRQAAHNLNYWRFGDYLAVGAGAHGKLTFAADNRIVRTAKQRHPKKYLATAGTPDCIAETRELSDADRSFEFFLNHLRLTETLPSARFEARTGLGWPQVQSVIDEAGSRGLLETVEGGVQVTALGMRFLNDLQGMFLEGEAGID